MQDDNSVTIVLSRLLPGLNGPGGMLRTNRNIGATKSLKESVLWSIKTQVPFLPKVQTPCTATLTRYHRGQPMDWDNATASFKYLLDAIVRSEIIPDDNPKVIISISCHQVKVRLKEDERMEVTFTPHYVK